MELRRLAVGQTYKELPCWFWSFERVGMVVVMTSAAPLFVSSPTSAIEAASAVPAAGLPRSSARLRLPGTSLVGLSSRAALSSAGKFSSVMHRGRGEVAGVSVFAAMVSSTVDLDARRPEVETAIDEAMENCITETHLNDSIPLLGSKIRGKVGELSAVGFSTCDLVGASSPVPSPALQSRTLVFSTRNSRSRNSSVSVH